MVSLNRYIAKLSLFLFLGALYVYFSADGGAMWSEVQKLILSDGDAGDQFGFSVSLHNDLLAVSVVYDDDWGLDSGECIFNAYCMHDIYL